MYVVAVPLRATKGPAQVLMSAAYSLNIWDLQHFMVLIKPSSPPPSCQVLFHLISNLVFPFFVDKVVKVITFSGYLSLSLDGSLISTAIFILL